MPVTIESKHIQDEVVVLETRVFPDDRGFFIESFRADQFAQLGLPTVFLQDNHSRSRLGVLRGLHFQYDPPMGKLMRVTAGAAYLVAVDIRKGSPTLGQWYGREVSEQNRLQIWAPPGFARGFCALTDYADVQYKCTVTYNPAAEAGIRWDDPEIGIAWPIDDPLLSPKDTDAQSLARWLQSPQSDRVSF